MQLELKSLWILRSPNHYCLLRSANFTAVAYQGYDWITELYFGNLIAKLPSVNGCIELQVPALHTYVHLQHSKSILTSICVENKGSKISGIQSVYWL